MPFCTMPQENTAWARASSTSCSSWSNITAAAYSAIGSRGSGTRSGSTGTSAVAQLFGLLRVPRGTSGQRRSLVRLQPGTASESGGPASGAGHGVNVAASTLVMASSRKEGNAVSVALVLRLHALEHVSG